MTSTGSRRTGQVVAGQVVAGQVVAGQVVAGQVVAGQAEAGSGAELLGEFRHEKTSPAVVNLLVHRGIPTGSALPATVLDLAARGYCKIEEVAPGKFLARLGHAPADPRRRLAAHELRVMDLMRERAVGHVVPVEALTLGADDESYAWWNGFAADVTDEAQAHRFVTFRVKYLALFIAFVALVVIMLTTSLTHDNSPVGWAVVGLASAVLVWVSMRNDDDVNRPPLTWSGRKQRRRWLALRHDLHTMDEFTEIPAAGVVVWGRALAYAAALDLAPAASHGIPIGPDPRHWFWVRRGGMWRQLHARYPRRFPPGWGTAPLTALVVGGLGTAIGAALLVAAVTQPRWDPDPPFSAWAARGIGDLESFIVGAAAVVLVVFGWELLCALVDLLTRPKTVTGVIVGRYVRQSGRWNPWGALVPRHWFLAIDTGDYDIVPGYGVSRAQFETFARGDVVTATVNRRLGHVRRISPAAT